MSSPNSNLAMTIKQHDDSDDYIEFTVRLDEVGHSGPLGDKQDNDDKQDKNDNNDNSDNNKRHRQRRGGGGLSDVDRREHPVDRLLD